MNENADIFYGTRDDDEIRRQRDLYRDALIALAIRYTCDIHLIRLDTLPDEMKVPMSTESAFQVVEELMMAEGMECNLEWFRRNWNLDTKPITLWEMFSEIHPGQAFSVAELKKELQREISGRRRLEEVNKALITTRDHEIALRQKMQAEHDQAERYLRDKIKGLEDLNARLLPDEDAEDED